MSTATTEKKPGTAVETWQDKPYEIKSFLANEPINLSVRAVQRFLCNKTKTGAICSDEQALKFIMLCKARQLNPFEGDAFLIGFDGKDGPQFSLVTAHQAFLKRAEVHPEFDGMESGVIVQHGDQLIDREGDFTLEGDILLGGWAVVFFKSRKHSMKKRLKLATFNQNRSRWNADPAGMIVKCAEADALRSAFPNSLGGMYLEDELPNELVIDGKAKSSQPLNRVMLPKTLANGTPTEPTDEQRVNDGPHHEEPSVTTEPERQPGEDPPEVDHLEEFDLDFYDRLKNAQTAGEVTDAMGWAYKHPAWDKMSQEQREVRMKAGTEANGTVSKSRKATGGLYASAK